MFLRENWVQVFTEITSAGGAFVKGKEGRKEGRWGRHMDNKSKLSVYD